ncbi:MAG TPA: ribonuclease HII [Ignavibacteriaceae bacterium]|jgi:ribonuclease HII
MKKFDNSFLNDKIKFIAGTDEAGRGPLAGPVVAAAVIYSPETFIEGVNDSKVLSEIQREKLFNEIVSKSVSYSVSVISPEIIDEINILNASLLAMKDAVSQLEVTPDLVLIDGNKRFDSEIPVKTIIKGDSKSFCIASASILAKVTRDRLMKKLSEDYPMYLWEKNKGYPTKKHREIIRQIGPSPLHRKTFLKKVLAESIG